jgi:hypothetical protein
MTLPKRHPGSGAVVIGPLSKATQSRLSKATPGKLAKIAGAPDTVVVENDGDDPRRLCEKLNEVVGTEGIVAPVLVDEEGNKLLPTGRFQVRFKKTPSGQQLASFAARHNVDLAKQNQWSSSQAEFKLRADDVRYFPDVAEQISADADVAAAWPDVRAAFRKTR